MLHKLAGTGENTSTMIQTSETRVKSTALRKMCAPLCARSEDVDEIYLLSAHTLQILGTTPLAAYTRRNLPPQCEMEVRSYGCLLGLHPSTPSTIPSSTSTTITSDRQHTPTPNPYLERIHAHVYARQWINWAKKVWYVCLYQWQQSVYCTATLYVLSPIFQASPSWGGHCFSPRGQIITRFSNSHVIS